MEAKFDEHDWLLHEPPTNPADTHDEFGCPLDWEKADPSDYDLDLGPIREGEYCFSYDFLKPDKQYKSGVVMVNDQGHIVRDYVTYET